VVEEDTDTAGRAPMKQVSDGNGLFDHVTLETVAAVCFGYVETNMYVVWRYPKAISKRVRWNNISKKTGASEATMQERRRT
jgi:hypothetical protein